MAKPTPFFATRADLLDWLGSVSARRRLALTEAGLFEDAQVRTMPLEECTYLGISDTGNHITDKRYLVHDESAAIAIREVHQRGGGIRYSVDQKLNPHTIGVRAGGTFGDKTIIAGQLGLGTRDAASDDLAQLLLKELRRQFTKIKSYYVGQQAASLLDSGARLTINSGGSLEYDLKR